jgi:hypothetical protein
MLAAKWRNVQQCASAGISLHPPMLHWYNKHGCHHYVLARKFWRNLAPHSTKQESTNFKKSNSHLQIPDARRMTWSKFHTEGPHIRRRHGTKFVRPWRKDSPNKGLTLQYNFNLCSRSRHFGSPHSQERHHVSRSEEGSVVHKTVLYLIVKRQVPQSPGA